MNKKTRIGLALSGGGYRAAAFHLGTLNKLNELGILEKVDVISTISGGSITGSFYILNKSNYSLFQKQLYKKLQEESVITKVVLTPRFLVVLISLVVLFPLLCGYLWSIGHGTWTFFFILLLVFLLARFQFAILPISSLIEKAYDSIFFQQKTLSDFPGYPEIAINATNLDTCRPFTFSQRKMGDSSYLHPLSSEGGIYFKHAHFPISRAVVASTCVPYAFNPVKIDKVFFTNEDDHKKCSPLLIDGGVYDNQGIHKLTQSGSSYECDVIITSDAGNKLPFKKSYNNNYVVLMRTVELFMQRIKAFQLMHNVFNNVKHGINKEIAYLSLGWDIEECFQGFIKNVIDGKVPRQVIAQHGISEEIMTNPRAWYSDLVQLLKENINYASIQAKQLSIDEIRIARKVGTNLKPFSKKAQDCLIRHAELLTELQVKLYCPSALKNFSVDTDKDDTSKTQALN